ncbi:MAG TPA: histidinol dehydrogenase [Deltaproteobacteria bacterium]|nr:histidinol dehydrogenase [Deltaproteobacteria bacterium]
MEVINTREGSWQDRLNSILARTRQVPDEIDEAVREIIDAVREKGDVALFDYTNRFDGFDPAEEGITITRDEMGNALSRLGEDILVPLRQAASRIEKFHLYQKEDSWTIKEDNGSILGQQVTPIDRVGIYIPGGKNAFPSTVLMNVIPAKIAGVGRIVVVSPTPDGIVNDTLLAAAHIAGAEEIFKVGGAQAVAALAYGTQSIPKVDKVVGPGNIYVAHAKRLLMGTIGIDAFAGPSEILVLADEHADARMVVADLLSQAEHDSMASSIFVTPSESLAQDVVDRCAREAETLPRKEVVTSSLKNHGICVVTRDLDEAFLVANTVAPEHLELMILDAYEHIGKVRNAGAIFLGYYSPEAIGDYIAGPNHTLPTGSTSRFSSPLGVYDFVKRSSIIGFTQQATRELGPLAVKIARAENLEAHARSVETRFKQ